MPQANTHTIKLYQRTYNLPILAGSQLEQLHRSIKTASQILRRGYHIVEKVVEKKAGFFGTKKVVRPERENLSPEQRNHLTAQLVNDYRILISRLDSHQSEYHKFFQALKQEIKDMVKIKCQEIAALEQERLRLESEAIENDEPYLLEVTALQKTHLLQTARAVGFAAILMLKKLDLMSQCLEKIAKDQHTQKQVLAEMVQKLDLQRKVYALQQKIERLGAEVAQMGQVALNFEGYMEQFLGSFQSLLDKVAQVDRDLSSAVRQIQDIASLMLNNQSNNLLAQDQSSEKILNFLVAGHLQKEHLLDALERSHQANYEVEFDLELEAIGQREVSLSECLENIQTYVQFQLNPSLLREKNPIPQTQSSLNLPSQQEIEPKVFISQTTGTNYYDLYCALQNQHWCEAEKQTRVLIERLSKQLNEESIRSFPSEDLKLIDQLWVQHSDGKLGFSVQKRIWQECGSPGADYKAHKTAWIEFGKRVNWQGGTAPDNWRYQREINVTNPQNYLGHLPYKYFHSVGTKWLVALFSRPEI